MGLVVGAGLVDTAGEKPTPERVGLVAAFRAGGANDDRMIECWLPVSTTGSS
jgi:hypothetical protein